MRREPMATKTLCYPIFVKNKCFAIGCASADAMKACVFQKFLKRLAHVLKTL